MLHLLTVGSSRTSEQVRVRQVSIHLSVRRTGDCFVALLPLWAELAASFMLDPESKMRVYQAHFQ